ncbi:MAG: hypothetical protein U0441_11150 [Polyangiaceae bacterium]
MNDSPVHPGTIRMVEVPSGPVRVIPADEVPETSRFVWFRDGEETLDADEATERVPVLEVHIHTVDAAGSPSPRASAAKIVVEEFGPGGRFLRRSEMPALR